MPPGGSRCHAELTRAAFCVPTFLSRVPPLLPLHPSGSLLPHLRVQVPAPTHSLRASPDALWPSRSAFPVRHSRWVSSEPPDGRIFSPDVQASVAHSGSTRTRVRSAEL
ncbi:hypothetical protein NDU88_010250 [Pleurodeles waltl]|uniref:Uncharacterized protein n=1 Tax=Pleurodeles waltl TaxID=8319 RepID=A0AAV7QV57_PLEWA|nr:hypothetical protein NDU88_010250 [Pleurodeles waltl]